MALDEARTGSDAAADHVSDHNLLHVRYNDGGWGSWTAVDGGVGFANSWVNYGGGNGDAEYRLHADGMVQLRGIIKTGSVGTTAFTLPTGYRPLYKHFLACTSDSVFGSVYVDSDGTLDPSVGSSTWFALDYLVFDSTGGS